MPLEVITEDSTPDDLNKDWPLGTDQVKGGDNHIRNLKLLLKNWKKWVFSTPNENLLINSDFSVWQRGDSKASPALGDYVCDRWIVAGNGAVGVINSKSQTQLSTEYRIAGGGVDSYKGIGQRIEAENLWGLAQDSSDVTFTLSFWAGSEAGDENDAIWFKCTSPTVKDDWAGEVDVVGLGKVADFAGGAVKRYVHTFTVPMTLIQNGMCVQFGTFNEGASTAPNSKTTLFSRVKLEIGSRATEYITPERSVNISQCQRFYFKEGVDEYTRHVFPIYASGYGVITQHFPTTMRVTPKLVLSLFLGASGTASGWSELNDRNIPRKNGFSAIFRNTTIGSSSTYVATYFEANAEL